MVQLWVNLPAKDKMAQPGYQTLARARASRSVVLAGRRWRGARHRGRLQAQQGPARTFTPIDVWDLRLAQGKATTLDACPKGTRSRLSSCADGSPSTAHEIAREAQLGAVRSRRRRRHARGQQRRDGAGLGGEPIDEPVVGQGPFVMNTVGEIKQAMLDFESGKFGAMQ